MFRLADSPNSPCNTAVEGQRKRNGNTNKGRNILQPGTLSRAEVARIKDLINAGLPSLHIRQRLGHGFGLIKKVREGTYKCREELV